MNLRNLSVLAYANGFTLWHYKAGAVPEAQLGALDYFGGGADMFAAGDMVLCSGEHCAFLAVVRYPGETPVLEKVR